MITIETKTSDQIIEDKELFKILYRLTNRGPHSSMKCAMLVAENFKFNAILCSENNRIVAWAILRENFMSWSPKASYNKKTRIDIFVSSKFRRQGIGKEIMNYALKMSKQKVVVFPFNPKGIKFYKNFNVIIKTY